MRDQNWNNDPLSDAIAQSEPAGTLKRALYLWERQPPSSHRSDMRDAENPIVDSVFTERSGQQFPDVSRDDAANQPDAVDTAIEDQLKRHAGRLAALEAIIPGDRRLDSPRFSLMMLNAFLGRTVMEGFVLARLPGLLSICARIDTELADLELEYPDALNEPTNDGDKIPVQIREEMRSLFTDLKAQQKAQHRQIISSLSALHASISELRAKLPDDDKQRDRTTTTSKMPPETAVIDELAKPLIDSERLLDPRPVLAAARSAASRAMTEPHLTDQPNFKPDEAGATPARPYRSVLLGTAAFGFLMILFGREAIQFLAQSPLTAGPLARP